MTETNEAPPKVEELVGEVQEPQEPTDLFEFDPKRERMKEWGKRPTKVHNPNYIKPFTYCGVRLMTVGNNSALFEPLNAQNWCAREFVPFTSRFDEHLTKLLTKFPVGNENVREIGLKAIFEEI